MSGRDELAVRAMLESDLPEILDIERVSFPTPWQRSHFLHELRGNPFGWNVVMEAAGRILAYVSAWIVEDEIQINDIAVRPDRRGEGIGTRFLALVLRGAAERGCRRATLEVRPSNHKARKLYAGAGFRQVGRRRGYYEDTDEDALILEATLR